MITHSPFKAVVCAGPALVWPRPGAAAQTLTVAHLGLHVVVQVVTCIGGRLSEVSYNVSVGCGIGGVWTRARKYLIKNAVEERTGTEDEPGGVNSHDKAIIHENVLPQNTFPTNDWPWLLLLIYYLTAF